MASLKITVNHGCDSSTVTLNTIMINQVLRMPKISGPAWNGK